MRLMGMNAIVVVTRPLAFHLRLLITEKLNTQNVVHRRSVVYAAHEIIRAKNSDDVKVAKNNESRVFVSHSAFHYLVNAQ